MAQTKQTPILSISLLTSGTRDTLKKCLDSLKPIMERIRSELIIVDTGCDNAVLEMLREYTDVIIPFTWCADFSAARNVGLKAAKGEWFLYIDDDEWFLDTKEIVDFFVSGEYRKFGIAHYIQRNYVDRNGERYVDEWVSRMIRIDKTTSFRGRIHEYFYPVKGENILLHCPVAHYGYIFDTEQDKINHYERNEVLLRNMLEEERDNVRWWIHLAQEYYGMDEYEKLGKLCKDALKVFANWNADAIKRCIGVFYCGAIVSDVQMHKLDLESFVEDALRDCRNTKLAMARLHYYAAELFYEKKKYDIVLKYIHKFLELYEAIHDDEAELARGSFLFVRDAFHERTLSRVAEMTVFSAEHMIPCDKKYEKTSFGNKELNIEDVLYCLKMAASFRPDMANRVKTCAHALTESVERQKVPSEMEMLAAQIKMKIKEFISMGMLKEALATLGGLKQLMPNDAELLELEKEIQAKLFGEL